VGPPEEALEVLQPLLVQLALALPERHPDRVVGALHERLAGVLLAPAHDAPREQPPEHRQVGDLGQDPAPLLDVLLAALAAAVEVSMTQKSPSKPCLPSWS
jgi:hypothetical protein